MYDWVTHAFVFLGASLGVLVFSIVWLIIFYFIVDEVIAFFKGEEPSRNNYTEGE